MEAVAGSWYSLRKRPWTRRLTSRSPKRGLSRGGGKEEVEGGECVCDAPAQSGRGDESGDGEGPWLPTRNLFEVALGS